MSLRWRPHRLSYGTTGTALNLTVKASQGIGIFPGQAIGIIISAIAHLNGFSATVTRIQIGIREPFSVSVLHTQNRIAVQRPSHDPVTFCAR